MSAASAARNLVDTLRASGVIFAAGGRQTEWHQWFARRGLEQFADLRIFPTLSVAVAAYRQKTGMSVAQKAAPLECENERESASPIVREKFANAGPYLNSTSGLALAERLLRSGGGGAPP